MNTAVRSLLIAFSDLESTSPSTAKWLGSVSKAASPRLHGSVSSTTLGPSSSTSLCDNARRSSTIGPSGVEFETLIWEVQVRVSWPMKIHREDRLSFIAKPFDEVQRTVADLIKDRILVGHAIYNDLKVRASHHTYQTCLSRHRAHTGTPALPPVSADP